MAKKRAKVDKSGSQTPVATAAVSPAAVIPEPSEMGSPAATASLRILSIFFFPPNSIARLGGSAVPLENYVWSSDPTIAGKSQTVIQPAVTFEVIADGSIRPYLPSNIRFRDGDLIRPVAPFLELWVRVLDGGVEREIPLTLDVLGRVRAGLGNLAFRVSAANRKAERRTGDPACAIEAREVAVGTDHAPKRLLAISPNQPQSQPLVTFDKPVPLGQFQVIRPVAAVDMGIDLSVIRLRFTPAEGEVYGPPTATVAPAPGTGKSHVMVKPENRILNGSSAWAQYDADYARFRNPEPSDTYDGASTETGRSWGVIDDTCDLLIECDLVVDGIRFQAQARVAVAPPHYALDRRPFVSLSDDLTDRDLPLVAGTPESQEELEQRINDLFDRAHEVASLFNVDANRDRAIRTNAAMNPGNPQVPNMPKTDDGMMRVADRPYADLTATDWKSVPHARLPLTDQVSAAHGNLADLNSMVVKLREEAERIREIIRPPYGNYRELPAAPAAASNAAFRDPRIVRDTLYDMRMPPFMRDSDATAMSLTHRQYDEILKLVAALEAKRDEMNVRMAAAPAAGAAKKTIYDDTPIRRKVRAFLATREQAESVAPAIRAERMLAFGSAAAAPVVPGLAKPAAAITSSGKTFPKNLTAKAAYRVAGNPEATRLESGVGNCFPGLEYDHRNLDRRFLPGLVFEFVSDDDATAQRRGARLVEVNLQDSAFVPGVEIPDAEQVALAGLRRALGAARFDPRGRDWFIASITQGGTRIVMSGPNAEGVELPFDGLTVWRLVRCLEPGSVELELQDRKPRDDGSAAPAITLQGWRRRYTDPVSGVVSGAYRPGELTQSLCSPWQHDFRDCGCFYWASNHPDVVHLEDLPGDPVLSGGQSADEDRALARVRWLRSDRAIERSSEARETYALNRPVEMDHYEINLRWQELPMVLADKEVTTIFRSRPLDSATPFANADEMAMRIVELATLEHVLTLEYLYAYFSVLTPTEIPDGPQATILREDVQYIRHFILLVAVSEMQHLRWANQLLWELRERGLIDPLRYGPSLGVSATIPVSHAGGSRPRALRSLTLDTLNDFIAVERPSSHIEGQYARVVATLRSDTRYPESLFQLASRIVNDGQDHFLRFQDIRNVMLQYAGTPWLRTLRIGTPADGGVNAALLDYKGIVDNLVLAYATGSITDRTHITAARDAMDSLQQGSEQLARNGIGVPYF